MKRNATIFLAIISIFVLMGADSCSSSESRDREDVEKQQDQYRKVQPIPRFDWSLERDVAGQLYRARNERVSTWTVWRSDYGKVEGDCPSIGYPLPYDTSFTNPLQRVYNGSVIEQAEPNGLFSSKNSISTWVRCVYTVNGKRVEAPVYIESKVTAYPFPVIVDYATGRVQPVANTMPSVTIKQTKRVERQTK